MNSGLGEERESIIRKTIKILQFVNSTIPNLKWYCSPLLKVLEFETSDEEAFLVCQMPNIWHLAHLILVLLQNENPLLLYQKAHRTNLNCKPK